MIRKLVEALERGLPPRRYVIGFFALLILVMAAERGLVAVMNWWVGEWLDPDMPAGFQRPGAYNMLLLMGLACVSMWRASAFNPALDSRYRTWLRSTPWTAGKPLPMGPVHLMWQDALLVGLVGLAWTMPPDVTPRVAIGLTFALPYSGCMAAALLAAGEMWSVCGAAALGFALLLTSGRPHWQSAAVAVGLCAYCDWAFRRALVRFPWDDAQSWLNRDAHLWISWHWPRLRDGGIVANEPVIPWRWAGALSVLTGWGAAVIAQLCMWSAETPRLPRDFESNTWLVLGLCSFFLATSRLACYVGDRASPLGLWARLRLGRWIIPGHDYVYLPSMAIVALAIALPGALFELGASAPLTAGLTATCAVLIALGAPPTLAHWSLTGEYRSRIRRQGVRKEWVKAG